MSITARLYLFSCSGKFEYALEDLTEIAGWIAKWSVGDFWIFLKRQQKEFEYAVIVGQLMALIDPEAHIEVISGMPEIDLLMDNCYMALISVQASFKFNR